MQQPEPAKSRWGNSEKLTLECATEEPVEVRGAMDVSCQNPVGQPRAGAQVSGVG